jgi:hypothetical protein
VLAVPGNACYACIKNRGQCYIRIGNTNQIATRSTILNVQRDLREMKSNIKKLKVVSEFFKQSFMLTISEPKNIDPDGIEKISLLDLQTLKSALIAAEGLLSKNNLLGGYSGADFKYQTIGSHYRLRELDRFTIYLNAFNSENNSVIKTRIKQYLCEKQFWCPEGSRSDPTV